MGDLRPRGLLRQQSQWQSSVFPCKPPLPCTPVGAHGRDETYSPHSLVLVGASHLRHDLKYGYGYCYGYAYLAVAMAILSITDASASTILLSGALRHLQQPHHHLLRHHLRLRLPGAVLGLWYPG
jgi:hypothetical protein